MTATPDVRHAQYADAVQAQIKKNPRIYAPFTVGEYLNSDWQMADWWANYHFNFRAEGINFDGETYYR